MDTTPANGLTQRQRDILEFETWRWTQAGRRDTAIGQLFDTKPIKYTAELNTILDLPAALAHAPVLVHRLRRLRQRRLERVARYDRTGVAS